MIILQTTKPIKCDTVLCDRNSKFEISTGSFKGDSYLCEKCFNEIKNLFKRTQSKNEERQ